jgi:hypothetical protein
MTASESTQRADTVSGLTNQCGDFWISGRTRCFPILIDRSSARYSLRCELQGAKFKNASLRDHQLHSSARGLVSRTSDRSGRSNRQNSFKYSSEEIVMDTTTLLIIVIVLIDLGGGGWYGRGRWF